MLKVCSVVQNHSVVSYHHHFYKPWVGQEAFGSSVVPPVPRAVCLIAIPREHFRCQAAP